MTAKVIPIRPPIVVNGTACSRRLSIAHGMNLRGDGPTP